MLARLVSDGSGLVDLIVGRAAENLMVLHSANAITRIVPTGQLRAAVRTSTWKKRAKDALKYPQSAG